MNDEQVFVWVLDIATQPLPKKLIFSAAGTDREQAEKKILAYFMSVVPDIPDLSPEVVGQWLKSIAPLTPEVKEGVWILSADSTSVP